MTVEHLHGVAYAGRVVNRPGAELQNEGSLIMGLGTALFEAIDFGDGQVANANLSDYNVPRAGDLPARFTHEIIEREGADGARPRRDRPAAGARRRSATRCSRSACSVHELPITPERVLAAVDAREGER